MHSKGEKNKPETSLEVMAECCGNDDQGQDQDFFLEVGENDGLCMVNEDVKNKGSLQGFWLKHLCYYEDDLRRKWFKGKEGVRSWSFLPLL